MYVKLTLMVLYILYNTFSISAQTVYTRQDSLRGYLSPLRSCMDIHFYDLSLRIDPIEKSLKGHNQIHYTATETHDKIQLDLFSNLILDSVLWKGSVLNVEREGHHFFVNYPYQLIKGEAVSLSVFYHGQPLNAKKAPWDGGWVFKEDSLHRPWIGVACEGIGASLWWPLKDHLSDEPDSMRMTYRVPDPLTAIGNGLLEKTEHHSDATSSYTWRVAYPINSYNVTCNIAHYTHITDTLQQQTGVLPLDYYVLDYNQKKATEHFKQVKPMLRAYEHYYSSYPFIKDGFALVETPYWGMEHQSCIAYGNNYTNYVGDFDYIIIHESAHEWWGNLISTQDHAELWIHESFTTYTENLLLEYYYGYDASVQYLMFQRQRIKNADPIIGPLDVNFQDWKGSDMYYKGAWILHTLRNTIQNDSIWFGLLKSMIQHFGYKTIQTNDLINYVNTYTGNDFRPFFQQYLYQASPPLLQYSIQKKGKLMVVRYQWVNTHSNFTIPLYLVDSHTWVRPSTNQQEITVPFVPKKRRLLWDTKSHYFQTREVSY